MATSNCLKMNERFRRLKLHSSYGLSITEKKNESERMSYCVGYFFSSLESQRLTSSKHGPNYARNWKILDRGILFVDMT